MIINDVEEGRYKIEYMSMFGTNESGEVTVGENGEYSVDLCFEHVSYEENEHDFIIDRLQDGEAYIIEYSHRGCFSSEDIFLVVEKIAGQYFSRMISGADSQPKTKKLSKQEIELFRIFEIELNAVKEWGGQSTSRNDFTLSYNDLELKVHSEGDWDGWYHLLNEISWDNIVQ